MAQNSVVQSSNGKTSIILQGNRSVSLNFSDKKISFSYGWFQTGGNFLFGSDTKFFGLEGSLKANDGKANLLSKGKFNLAGDLGGYYGMSWNTAGNEVYTAYVIGKVNRSGFNLLDSLDQISNENDGGLELTLGFNGETETPGNIAILFGTSFVFGSANNLDDLTTLEVSTFKFNQDSTALLISENKTAYGTSHEFDDGVFNFQWNMDFVFLPLAIEPAGFIAYSRLDVKNEAEFDIGAGVVLGKQAARKEIIGGAMVEIKDSFASKHIRKKLTVNLVVGYPF